MRSAVVTLLACSFTGCVAPRAMTETGRVTPHEQIRGGVTYSFNGASATAGELYDGFAAAVDRVVAEDTPTYDQTTKGLSQGLIAFAVDPVGPSSDLWLRYGLIERLDLGYRFASGTHVLDARHQFLGAVDAPHTGWSGSAGLQVARQSFEFPSVLGLNKLQDFLGFEAKRTDILLPIIFSRSFGVDEKYGALSLGVLLGRVSLNYGFEPINLAQEVVGNVVEGTPVEAVHDTKSFFTYGGFGSLKLGYQRAYILAGLGVYHQDYGSYRLLDGAEVSLSGFTVVPTLGVEGRFR